MARRLLWLLSVLIFKSLSLAAQEGELEAPIIQEVKSMLDTAAAGPSSTRLYIRLGITYLRYSAQRDSAVRYIDLAEKSAIKYQLPRYLGGVYLTRASIDKKNGEFEKADSLIQLGIGQFKLAKDSAKLFAAYNNQAALMETIGNEEAAINSLLKAQELANALQNFNLLVANKSALSLIYNRLDRPMEAWNGLIEVQHIIDQVGIEARLYWMKSIGQTGADLYEQTAVDSFLQKGLTTINEGIKEADSLDYKEMMAELRKAKIRLLGNLVPAPSKKIMQILDTIIVLGQQLDDAFLLHQATMNQQQIYLHNNQPQKAYKLNEKVEAYAIQLNNPRYFRTTYKRMYESAKATSRFKEALSYHEAYKTYEDSTNNATQQQLYLEVLEKYENERQALEIIKLNRDKTQLQLQQNIQRKSYYVGLALALLLLSIVLSLYYRKQRSLAREKAQYLVTEQKLIRAQMNPHFIFNALNSIKRLYVDGRTNDANDFLTDFSNLLRQILERSHQTMIPVEQEVAFLQLYLDLEKRRLGDRLNYLIQFEPDDFEFDDSIPSLILQPLVENSIWHGIMKVDRPGEIVVRVLKEDDFIHCIVEDNGIGYFSASKQPDTDHQARGMNLVKSRLGKQGEIYISELTNQFGQVAGTKIELAISQL